MKYSVNELQDENNFRLVHTLSLNEMVRFVFNQLRNSNAAIVAFYGFTFCSFVWMASSFFFILLPGHYGLARILLNCFLGFIIWPIILIPVHEIIHAVVYKLVGAPGITFGIKPDSYLFYVTADKYVIGKNSFLVVAFTPFIIITVLLALLTFFTDNPLSWSFITCLFVHTTMCAGDFAIAGFFLVHSDQEMYTYDDTEKEETYFYVRTNP